MAFAEMTVRICACSSRKIRSLLFLFDVLPSSLSCIIDISVDQLYSTEKEHKDGEIPTTAAR